MFINITVYRVSITSIQYTYSKHNTTGRSAILIYRDFQEKGLIWFNLDDESIKSIVKIIIFILYNAASINAINLFTNRSIELIPLEFYLAKWTSLVSRVFGNNTNQQQHFNNKLKLSHVRPSKSKQNIINNFYQIYNIILLKILNYGKFDVSNSDFGALNPQRNIF